MGSSRASAQQQDRAAAIVRTRSGVTKAYREGDDWRVMGPSGSIRYASVWGSDEIGSLKRALRTMVESLGDSMAESEILYSFTV